MIKRVLLCRLSSVSITRSESSILPYMDILYQRQRNTSVSYLLNSFNLKQLSPKLQLESRPHLWLLITITLEANPFYTLVFFCSCQSSTASRPRLGQAILICTAPIRYIDQRSRSRKFTTCVHARRIMKIIRSRCRPQRPQVATAAPVTEIVKPKRKALLIGINYETTKPDDPPESDTLRGPHRNVIEMKALLMGKYL